MNKTLISVIEQYRELDRGLLPYARYYMSEETMKALKRSSPTYLDGSRPVINSMMGIPVLIDDNMPLGVVRLDAETPLDRMVRLAQQAGATINIMKPTFPSPTPAPVPEPTLRALLRHWLKKLRNR